MLSSTRLIQKKVLFFLSSSGLSRSSGRRNQHQPMVAVEFSHRGFRLINAANSNEPIREMLVLADRLEDKLAFEPELSCAKSTTETPRFLSVSFVFYGRLRFAEVSVRWSAQGVLIHFYSHAALLRQENHREIYSLRWSV